MERDRVHSRISMFRRQSGRALLALLLFVSAAQAADPNLVAWYKLDDGNGSSATDSSGNGHTGTLVNSPQWVSGIVGGALQFDGSSNYVAVPNSPDLGGGSFTLTAWINTTTSGVDQKFIDKWNDNSGNFQFSFQVFHDQHLWLSIRQTNGVEAIASGTTTISPNRWYHAAAVSDAVAKTITIYVNGVAETLQANPNWDGTVQSVAMEMNIGRKCSVFDYFKGKIDDARVYNRALSQAKVQSLVNAAPPVATTDSYSVGYNHTLTVAAPGLLANDYDTANQALTATKLTDPLQGALLFNTDGSFSYTPPNGFSGNVSFTYKNTNASGSSSTAATVTINVASPTLAVSTISPSTGSVLTALPTEIAITFSSPIDQTTATTGSVTLWRAGTDGIWDTADDVKITLTSPQIQFVNATTMKIDLSGLNLPNDHYRVMLDGTVKGYMVHSGNFMNVPNFGMVVPTDEMTVEFWQKFEGGEFHIPTTFGLEPENTANRFKVNSPWNSYDYLFFGFGATTYGIQYVNTRGAWHHIAGVCSKSQNLMSIYLDGNLIGTTAQMTPFVRYVADLQVPNADFQPFIGGVDEFRIWDVARTAQQIQTNYRKNLRGNEAGLVAYWNFNGNGGTGSTVSDVSPNGYTGTLSANPPTSWPLSDAPLQQGLADLLGNILDGDGDGFAGGDFVSEFTLAAPLRVTAPTTGLLLYGGKNTFVSWTNGGLAGSVDIALSTDNGATFGAPFATVPASQLSYVWTIPSVTSSQCRIKVSSSTNPAVYAMSGVFTIEPHPVRVAALSFTDGSTLTLQPPTLTVTVDVPLQASTVNATNVVLTRAGPDGNFGTTDDVIIASATVSLSTPTQISVDLSALLLPNNKYQLLLRGSSGGLLDTYGSLLDGDFAGTFPSGDGNPGGDFVTGFTLNVPPFKITSISPGLIVNSAPAAVIATFSQDLDTSTVTAGTCAVIDCGADGIFGTADDQPVALTSISFPATNQVQLGLPAGLPNHRFRTILKGAGSVQVLSGGIRDVIGTLLDGEFSGTFPSGDGTPGGDFTADFIVIGAQPAPTVSSIAPSSYIQNLKLSGVAVTGNNFIAVGQQHPGAVPFGGNYYLYVQQLMTWSQAKAYCESLGGHLATISSAAENAFVNGLNTSGGVWIGSTDEAHEGQFTWITGETATYTNWASGEPNNSGGNENYAIIYPSGQWNDLNGTATSYFVCEFEGGPAIPTVHLSMAGQPDVQAGNVVFKDSSHLTFDLDLAGAAAGAWDVVVVNPDGQSGTLAGGFTVRSTPQLQSVVPSSGLQGTTVNLTITGTNLPVFSGQSSGANTVSFDGINDAFQVPSSPGLNSPNITIEAWVKEGFEVLKRNNWGWNWEQFIVSVGGGGNVVFWVANGGARYPLYSASQIGHDWTHIACTYDGSTQRIYINGVLDAQSTVNLAIDPGNEYMALYSDPFWGHNFAKGSMSEFRFWKVVRTQAQIQSTMNVALTGGDPNLVCRWDFANGGPNLVDTTGNGNNGTPVDHPTFGPLRTSSPVLIGLSSATGTYYSTGTLTSTSTNIQCSVDLTGVPGGVYDIQLIESGIITATLPTSFTVTLTATLHVTSGTLPLTFISTQGGGNPANQTLQVSNSGSGSFTFSATTDASWLSVSPSSDTLSTQTDTLTMHVDASTLTSAASPYYQNIIITAPGVANSPVIVPVKVIVSNSSGLVAWWRLDENSGSIAHDSSGGGHDGTLINNPTWSSGRINGALNFSGGNYVEVSYAPELNPAIFTICGWAKVTGGANTYRGMVTSRDDFTPRGYLLYAGGPHPGGDNNWQFWTGSGSNAASWNDLGGNPIGTDWTFVAGTYDGTTMRLYENGLLVATRASNLVLNTARPLRIGAGATEGPANFFFQGLIDDVRLYNRVLSPAEIAALGKAYITDTNGVALDGEFNGPSVPSGNGVAGGNYVATFTISTPKLKVTGLTPTPGTMLSVVPTSIVADFSKDLDPASVNANTVLLTRAGFDGTLNTVDDITLAPASVSVIGTQSIKIDLTGVTLLDDTYQIRLLGGATNHITDSMGNILDGEYSGTLPSGNGTAGGDFVATFTIATPQLQVTALTPIPGSALNAPPVGILATFSKNLNASSVNSSTIHLVNAGADGVFGTADDIAITPAAISVSGTSQVLIDLSGVQLPDGKYQVTLSGGSSTGNALRFDGVNSFVYINSFGPTAPTTEITVEFWQRVNSIKNQSTFGLNPVTDGNRMMSHDPWVDGNIIFDFGDFANGRLQYPMPSGVIGAWNHIALVSSQSGSFMRIYRNGVLEAQKSGASSFTPGAYALMIGSDGVSNRFGGDITEFRIWNVARTQAQIVANMQHRLAGSELGLLGYWDFQEGTGLIAHDKTGHGYDGLLGSTTPATNAPTWVASPAPVYSAITDANGKFLDGEFDGTHFPSGNGTPRGDFVATFTLSTPKLTVTQLTPAPGSTLTSAPSNIVATLSKGLDSASVNSNTVLLTRAGTDGATGTGDDVAIVPASIGISGTQAIKIDLSGVTLPDDIYQIRLLGGATTHVTDLMGNVLDGEFAGALPSGNGTAGGDFVTTFRLQRPPVANPGMLVTDENKIVFGTLSATSSSGAPLTYQIVTNGTKGTAQIVPGSNFFSYSPGPQQVGLDSFTFKANDGISDSNVAIVAVAINAIDLTPVITSPAIATPNPAKPGETVNFNVSASSPDGAILTFVWDFGDGTQGGGNSTTHVYDTVGFYAASVAIYGPSGAAIASFVTVHIAVSAVSLDPQVGTAQSMSVSKIAGAVDFARTSNDAIIVSGAIPGVAKGFVPAGVVFSIDAGGAKQSFTLDSKGKSKNSNGSLALKLPHSKQGFPGGSVPFVVKLINGAWASGWNMAPSDARSSKPVTMAVNIGFQGQEYSTTVTVSYFPKPKNGKFKK